MFNSVVFNVVIGLIFIYLLYSLLGTVLAEIIATKISLRARKRKIQMVLFIIGFLLAWSFNADTIKIVKTLSVDTDARDKLVNLAGAYLQSNSVRPAPLALDSMHLNSYNLRLDSLMAITVMLNNNMEEANTILGLGSWLPDTLHVLIDKRGSAKFPTFIDRRIIAGGTKIKSKEGYSLVFTMADKLTYFFKLPLFHFFGFLLTAIAISLGAPFWFDLLNKLMRLRTSVKQETVTATVASVKDISPLKREG